MQTQALHVGCVCVWGPAIRENPISAGSQGDNERWLLYVLEMIEWNIVAVYESPLLVANRLTAHSPLPA